ncbi:MAG: hypothetical protein ACRD0V_07300 [Acidimicrobiales bacterium]
MADAETVTCRTCRADIAVTRDEDGRIEQLTGSGIVQCDACYAAERGSSGTGIAPA